MGRQEKIEIRTIVGDKHRNQTNNGARIFAKKIVSKYSLSANATGCISHCVEKHPDLYEYIEYTILTLIEYGKKANMNHDEINNLIIYFIGHNIFPRPEQLKQKIGDWENKGAETKDILLDPEILRTDVSDEFINIISALLRKAGIEPTPKEVSKYISLGITLDPKALIKKIGICLAIKVSASDILKNYKLLKENIPVEMLYAAVFECAMNRDIKTERIPGSLPPSDNSVDLKDVYTIIKLEENAIKDVGKLVENRVGMMSRYVYGPKAAFSATYIARSYLETESHESDKRK